MIIESGLDILQVLWGAQNDADPPALWLVAMDESLRLISVEPIVDVMIDEPEKHLDEIENALYDSTRPVVYFALGWSTKRVYDDAGWLHELDARLRDRAELAAATLLGQVVFERTAAYISLPQCEFTLYPEFRLLPRALAIPGPHGWECRCAVCGPEYRFAEEQAEADYDYDRYDYEHDGRGSDDPTYDPMSKRWYPDPARAYKRWTSDEEATVTRSHAEGLSCFDISLLVQRQPSAVASRLNRLGLSSKTVIPENARPPLAPTGSMPEELPPVR